MKKPLDSAEEKKTGDITKAEIEAIKSGLHSNPFALLGVHETPEGFSARCFIPGAEEVSVLTLDGNFVGELKQLDPDGFFEGPIDISKPAGALPRLPRRCRMGGDRPLQLRPGSRPHG